MNPDAASPGGAPLPSVGPHVLVTGGSGFLGKHLVAALRLRQGLEIHPFDMGNTAEELSAELDRANAIFHLAGVNRPPSTEEYEAGNAGFTGQICQELRRRGRAPLIVFSSSIQAAIDNPYGVSKRHAEEALRQFAEQAGAPVVIFRFKNLFGKWCRPNYNSVVATFCHNIARDLPIAISDPSRELELSYVDDVVASLLQAIDQPPRPGTAEFREVPGSYKITLGELAALIRSFRESRRSLVLPPFDQPFVRALYGTYLSYLEGRDFAYPLTAKTDPRGSLAEFVKSASFGQVFVSRTKPGITRGNHYHHTKTEKFLVVEGEAVIRFRHLVNGQTVEHRVSGADFKVVDIPPGYTHSIENVGSTEMVVIFWASEIFDTARPDTYPMPVKPPS